MLTLFELFGVAFLFIFGTALLHMTTSTNCVQMKAK